MEYNPIFMFSFVCGRYGHAHLGHKSLIDKGLQLSKKTYVGVGSAQEKGTLRNPFPVKTRIKVIKEMYPDISEERLVIAGIDDMSNELNRSTSWGTYLKKHLIEKFDMFPDLLLYGMEENRSNWFKQEDMVNTHELLVPRGLTPISGTEIRGFLLINDEKSWRKNTPETIYHLYSELREELMNTPIYKEIYNKILETGSMDMDGFMKVYDIYAEEDKLKKISELEQLKKCEGQPK